LDDLLPLAAAGKQSGGDGEQVVRVSAIDDIPAPSVTGERTRNQVAIAGKRVTCFPGRAITREDT